MEHSEPRNRLQEIREAADPPMSRAALADFLELSELQVRRMEEWKARISAKHIPALAAHFGVTSDHLLGLDRRVPTSTGGTA